MVSTRNKRLQNKRLLNQLSESDTDFMMGQNNYGAQNENRSNTADGNITLNSTNNPTQVGGPEVDMHTGEKNIVHKVRSEVVSVMTTVETRVQDAVLTAIENLMIPGTELAMKSVNASSDRFMDTVVLDPDQRVFQQISKAFK